MLTRLFRIAWIFWFDGPSVEPDLRLSEVDVVIPDDSVPVGIGMGTPEDRLVLKGTEGLTLQERMSERGLSAPIVFISGHADVAQSVRAMKHGAVDFLEKPFDVQDLLDAVDRAIELDTALRKQRDGSAQTIRGLERLTSREYEVMTHVIAGRLNKVIAKELEVTEKTVKVHRGRVMKKMEARSLAELVRMTERAGIEGAKPHDSRDVI